MDFFSAIDISASGLKAQRTRMNLCAANLANINSTSTPEGGPYRRKLPIFSPASLPSDFTSTLERSLQRHLSTVRVTEVVEDPSPLRQVFDPQHPDADDKGFVSYPNINLMEEMVDLSSATRAFEANLSAINSSKKMLMKALEIGK